MLGKARGGVGAVFTYGDENPTALTTQMPQAPKGFDLAFQPQTRKSTQGFTMIEVMMVMGLLVIVSSLGLFMSMETLRGGSFRNDRAAAVSALQRARSLAVNNMCFGDEGDCGDEGKPHGVHFGTDEVVIFQGDSYDADAIANEVIKFDSKTTKIGSGSADNIIFKRLSGDLAGGGTGSVSITDGMGHSSVVEVNSEGRIDWTN
jgi:prepilin-type N-terminal cleavage/methylation domain-containing protein